MSRDEPEHLTVNGQTFNSFEEIVNYLMTIDQNNV